MGELFDAPSTRPVAPPDAVVTKPSEPGSARTTGLRVRYPDTSTPALKDVDLDISPGEIMAIAGPSGAGKTTLALALARMIAPEAGRILLDGVDAATEDPDRTRERIVLVAQRPHVFRASVRENLLAPHASNSELWAALQAARLADHVAELPDGLDTVLSEQGATWSGGERQRLGGC